MISTLINVEERRRRREKCGLEGGNEKTEISTLINVNGRRGVGRERRERK